MARDIPAKEPGVIQDEIADLEKRLEDARSRLARLDVKPAPFHLDLNLNLITTASSAQHFLLLLSDSALPLGSFAFSSGLESYLAHAPRGTASFAGKFLPSSVSSYASTSLPFVLAAHRAPVSLPDLDDQLDAAVVCTVGRRASVSQGRALLGIWERSFRPARAGAAEGEVLARFAALLRESNNNSSTHGSSHGSGLGISAAAAESSEETALPPPVSAHLAPLFGVVCSILGLDLRQTAYVFMLGHVKALISAAVRASVFGPYQAQKVLASEQTQRMIDVVIDREWETPVECAGQSIPVMDLWIGRHELLYSRIFNS